jgi:hypothetical protein
MPKIGERVVAISHSDDETIYLFGFGVYEGDFDPEEAGGPLGEMCREMGRGNPRIRLDNGKIVYGCECWWHPEEKTTLDMKKKVVLLDIDEERKKCKGE